MNVNNIALFVAILLNLVACAGSASQQSTSYQAKSKYQNSTAVLSQTALNNLMANKLQIPIRGIANRDYFYTNYVDHDARNGAFKDSNCGTKTYDGHQGTDFAISDFKTMDQGVEVLAALAGVIEYVHDGEFDRQKSRISNMKANFVRIRHTNGLVTHYYHLKKDSISVKVGDEVNAGDVLGLVGSSGFSSGPHLHFAAYVNGRLIDPFSGSCNPNPSLWGAESKYQKKFGVWNNGITSLSTLNSEQVKESPINETSISTSAKRVNFWVHFLNAPKNMNYTFRFIRPDGKQYASFAGRTDEYQSDGWLWAYASVANTKMTKYLGQWRIEFIQEGKILASSEFTLIE